MNSLYRQYRAWQPFVIIVGIFLLVIARPLFSNNVERVGLENGISAKVIRIGESSFWQPVYGVEMEHLEQATYMPLAHWIEHLAMTLFKDGLLFDKIYSLCFFALICCMLCACWYVMGHRPRTLWLPLMFALLSPIMMRMATGNYTELPLTFFLLTSVYFYLKGLVVTPRNLDDSTRAYNFLPGCYGVSRVMYCVLSGLFVMLAFLVKGTIGLLPLSLPVVLWMTDDRRKGNWFPWLDVTIMLAMLLLCSLLLGLLDHASFRNIAAYWQYCFVGFPREEAGVISRFCLFKSALLQMWLPLLVFVLLCVPLVVDRRFWMHVFFWRHKKDLSAANVTYATPIKSTATRKMNNEEMRNDILCVVFLVIGLLGLIIMSCGRCLRDYHVIPIIPFFALALSCFVENSIHGIPVFSSKRWRMVLTFLACGFVLAGLLTFVALAANMRSHPGVRSELEKILPHLEENETVCATEGVSSTSVPALFFKRYKNVQVDNDRLHAHLLSRYDEVAVSSFRSFYDEASLNTSIYHLYQRNQTEDAGHYVMVTDSLEEDVVVVNREEGNRGFIVPMDSVPGADRKEKVVEQKEIQKQEPSIVQSTNDTVSVSAVQEKKKVPARKRTGKRKEPSYMPTY